jgi:hypothetical protein
MFLRNVGIYLQVHTTSLRRRPASMTYVLFRSKYKKQKLYTNTNSKYSEKYQKLYIPVRICESENVNRYHGILNSWVP